MNLLELLNKTTKENRNKERFQIIKKYCNTHNFEYLIKAIIYIYV